MLSLSPRFDLFRFVLPKDFLPHEVEEKYRKILNRNSAVIMSPIDYLNESIQGVTFPAIESISVSQDQHGSNTITRSSNSHTGLGKINVEPKVDITKVSHENPLQKISKEFQVTFRLNQGLYNYFMIYETIFYEICKPLLRPSIDELHIDILDENGLVTSQVIMYDCVIDGIEGLDFNFSKIDRESGSFSVTFKFNNINFEIIDSALDPL